MIPTCTFIVITRTKLEPERADNQPVIYKHAKLFPCCDNLIDMDIVRQSVSKTDVYLACYVLENIWGSPSIGLWPHRHSN